MNFDVTFDRESSFREVVHGKPARLGEDAAIAERADAYNQALNLTEQQPRTIL